MNDIFNKVEKEEYIRDIFFVGEDFEFKYVKFKKHNRCSIIECTEDKSKVRIKNFCLNKSCIFEVEDLMKYRENFIEDQEEILILNRKLKLKNFK